MPEPDAPIACSLDANQAQTRQARWQGLAATALTGHSRTRDGARHIYRALPQVEAELADLIELESHCCPFLAFELSRVEDALVLDVTGPDEAAGILDLFASPPSR